MLKTRLDGLEAQLDVISRCLGQTTYLTTGGDDISRLAAAKFLGPGRYQKLWNATEAQQDPEEPVAVFVHRMRSLCLQYRPNWPEADLYRPNWPEADLVDHIIARMTDRYYVPIAQAQIPGPWRSCCSSATSGRACSSGTQHPDRRPTTNVPGPSQPSRPRTARTRRAHKPPSVGSVLAPRGPRPYMPTHRRSYPWPETANQAKPCQVRNAHNRGAHQSPIPPIPDPGKTPAHQPRGSTSISCSPVPEPLPADAVPRPPQPQQPLPADAVPQQPLPADAVPQQPLPADAVPQQPLPADAVPQQPLPADAVPQQPLSDDVEPQHPLPDTAAPQVADSRPAAHN
ncbi:hypothetical protein QE152_g1878 [Popillia japonica]|uniref:Gag protein n=1 Tax=Popillia japonica TaxID=7064 RepID=A0AAW1N7G4_POPJA